MTAEAGGGSNRETQLARERRGHPILDAEAIDAGNLRTHHARRHEDVGLFPETRKSTVVPASDLRRTLEETPLFEMSTTLTSAPQGSLIVHKRVSSPPVLRRARRRSALMVLRRKSVPGIAIAVSAPDIETRQFPDCCPRDMSAGFRRLDARLQPVATAWSR